MLAGAGKEIQRQMVLNQIFGLRSFVPWHPSPNHTIKQIVRSLCAPNVRVEVVRDRSVSNRSAAVSHNRVWDPLLDPAWFGHGPTCSFQIGGACGNRCGILPILESVRSCVRDSVPHDPGHCEGIGIAMRGSTWHT